MVIIKAAVMGATGETEAMTETEEMMGTGGMMKTAEATEACSTLAHQTPAAWASTIWATRELPPQCRFPRAWPSVLFHSSLSILPTREAAEGRAALLTISNMPCGGQR